MNEDTKQMTIAGTMLLIATIFFSINARGCDNDRQKIDLEKYQACIQKHTHIECSR